MNYIELLSPAGSFEAVKAAIAAGADAIYMGGSRFGARAYAESAESGDSEIIKAINYAHEKGKKFYLTVNTLLKQKELKDLFLYVDNFAGVCAGGSVDSIVDAFIVQDLGVAKLLHEKYHNIPLHASTQMTICSIDGVRLAESLGFKRVVLARELSFDEIKYIRENTNIELEVFVHGSMCYAYSGACMMSSFIGGQSGNRGRCKGPCRHEYIFSAAKTEKNKTSGEYILSMKDMCNLKFVKALKDIGIDSLKIEGRMRKPLYVAGVTQMYRKYIDDVDGAGKNLQNDEKFLQEVYDKGGFATYLNQHNDKSMIQMIDRKPRTPNKKVIDFITDKYLNN